MNTDPLDVLSQANSSDESRDLGTRELSSFHNINNENLALNVIRNRQQYLFLFEDLMSDIGYGDYQKRIEFILGVLMLLNGCEIIVIALSITDFLINQNVSENVIILLSSFIFFGFSVGSIYSKIIWNRFGYKRSLLITLTLYLLISLFSVYPFSAWDFIIFRAICAILMNLVKNFGYNLLVEFCYPMKSVQETYFDYYCYYIIGQWICCFVALLIHDCDLAFGLIDYYKSLIKMALIICLITYYLISYYVMESIKYSLYWNRYEQAFATFNHLAFVNKKVRGEEEYLDDLKKSSLTYWTELYNVQMEAQNNITIIKKFQNIYNNTDDTQKLLSVLLIINSMIIALSFYSFPLVVTLFEFGNEKNEGPVFGLNVWCILFINFFVQYLGLIFAEIIRKLPTILKISIVLIGNIFIIVCSILIYSTDGYAEIFIWTFSIMNSFLFANNSEMKGYFFNADIKETAKEVIKFMENITFLFVPCVFWSNLLFSYNYIFLIYSGLYIFNLFIVLGLYFYEKWRVEIEILLHQEQVQ